NPSVVHSIDEPLLLREVEEQPIHDAVAELGVIVVAVEGVGAPPFALQAPGADESDDAAGAAVGAVVGLGAANEVGLAAVAENFQAMRRPQGTQGDRTVAGGG